ncbi:MAG TPA: polyphosphate kinase 1 [Anaerolineales bacterium]|nr:polyphosphate kinase 1 [Anaerolineales bacterium]
MATTQRATRAKRPDPNGSPEPNDGAPTQLGTEDGASESGKDLPVAPLGLDLDDPRLYINRELSMLEFFRRVLEEARDSSHPLLERVKFLAIVASNMDEFFMVRVAGLKQQVKVGVVDPSEEQTPAEQLAAIRKVVNSLMQESRACWERELRPTLAEAGVHVLDYGQLSPNQRRKVEAYFQELVFPVLTPLAFDPGRPFPHISNLSLNLAVLIRGRDGEERFARVKVPNTLPRLVPIKRSSGATRKDGTVPREHYFVWLEQVIAANLHMLFPGMEIVEAHPFHVTRDADIIIQELEAEDLLETMEESVRQRRFGSVVRVQISGRMPERMREILVDNLEVTPLDLYSGDEPIDISRLMGLMSVDRHDLKDPPFVPGVPPVLRDAIHDSDLFSAIRQGDVLLHHPYDSFTPVLQFLQTAADDNDVLAIKQTLYRVGRNSPVVEALLEAIENDKQVAALVELKARFDEESNIGWAKRLEAEGVHVVYGLPGLKTHSKVAMVVRKEGTGIRRYVHLATGNYNPVTAGIYTDLGLFTCDDEIGADCTDLFNYLTGYSAKTEYRKLLVAPINLRARMQDLICREIEHAQRGEPAHIIFKMNALVDKPMIKLLYAAARAGVQIDLIVRSICGLRPGIKGLSENVRVRSIVGRFLEHSRIYWFANAGQPEVFVGSADLMPRNIDRRVEVLFPVGDPRLVRSIRDDILGVYLADNVKARQLKPDGSYARVAPGDSPVVNAQAILLKGRSGASLPTPPAAG